MYAQGGASAILPFGTPGLHAIVEIEIAGVTVRATEPVVFRTADPVRGELRRTVNVVPPVAVGFEAPLLIVRTSAASRAHRVDLHLVNLADRAAAGTLSLNAPPGWRVTPATVPFAAARRDDRVSASFTVTRPASAKPGEYTITATADVGGRTFGESVQLIAYPHIQTHRLYTPAAATARIIDLALPALRVGYIMGTGDAVPDALRWMGATVTLLDDRMLATGDLTPFDAIVVGIRASEARPAFAANAQRLRRYMEGGGTLVVQYQQSEYIALSLAPYPAEMTGNSRVTDETAPVRILAPSHQAFTYPNRIGPADFEGWVQERNLYAFTRFDARYTPLLESADPGEMPQQGAQVYARVGKGHYVYTSYAWFRQLPAGVPGAYRQFANLISLSKTPPRAGARGAGSAPRTAGVPVEADARTRPSR